MTMALFGFIFWLIVAHLYTTKQVGIAATLISSMNFIAYASLLGFNTTFIRFLPKSKNRNTTINTGLLVVTVMALLLSFIYVTFIPSASPKLAVLHQNLFYGIGFIILGISAAINLATDSIFIAYRSAIYNFAIDGLVASSTQLLLPVILLSLGAYGIYAAQGLAALVAMSLSIYMLIKKFNYLPAIKLNKFNVRDDIRYSFGNYIANLFNFLPSVILPLIILNTLGAAQAGYFYLAFMICNVLYNVTYAVAQSMLAEGSYNEQNLVMLAKRAASIQAVIIIPATALLTVIGPILLRIFGDGYAHNASQLIILLALTSPLLAAEAIGSVIMRIKKRTKTLVFINLGYALSICTLALLWGKRGLVWIGLAWLIGQALTLVTTYVSLALHYHFEVQGGVHKPV